MKRVFLVLLMIALVPAFSLGMFQQDTLGIKERARCTVLADICTTLAYRTTLSKNQQNKLKSIQGASGALNKEQDQCNIKIIEDKCVKAVGLFLQALKKNGPVTFADSILLCQGKVKSSSF